MRLAKFSRISRLSSWIPFVVFFVGMVPVVLMRCHFFGGFVFTSAVLGTEDVFRGLDVVRGILAFVCLHFGLFYVKTFFRGF